MQNLHWKVWVGGFKCRAFQPGDPGLRPIETFFCFCLLSFTLTRLLGFGIKHK